MHDLLFTEIDRRWAWPQSTKIQLHVIGSGALMMQCDYARRTNDGDVIETLALGGAARQNLKALAGKGTELSRECGMYLDVVVVSKLKRFHRNDQDDIRAMIERDRVPHSELLERFRAAVDCFAYDARADDLPAIVKNLHVVERDLLFEPPSEIELPHWI